MATESLPTKTTAQIVIAMGALQVLVVGAAVLLTRFDDSLWPLAIAIPAVGIIGFTAIYLDTRRIRNAIAAGVILVYLAMLGLGLNSGISRMVEENEFLKDLYTDFRTLVTTVAAFYFVADATERVVTRGTDTPATNDSAPRAG